MYFKCDINNITVQQLAALSAVESLYREQSMQCTVLSIEPMVTELKPQVSALMRERLFVQRIPNILKGHTARLEGNTLVISPEETVQPVKRGRPRAS